jgi:hypothetical protein
VVDRGGGVSTEVDVTLAAYGLSVFVVAGTGAKVVDKVVVPTVTAHVVVAAGTGGSVLVLVIWSNTH